MTKLSSNQSAPWAQQRQSGESLATSSTAGFIARSRARQLTRRCPTLRPSAPEAGGSYPRQIDRDVFEQPGRRKEEHDPDARDGRIVLMIAEDK